MKTFILFCITCIISTGALLTSLNMKNNMIGIGVSLAVISLFVMYLNDKAKRRQQRKKGERMFMNWMRSRQAIR